MRRRFCGRQPLCGTGVTSEIEVMRMPRAPRARTEDSRPGPGPLISTSRFLMPCSMAARPATSDATWAANGVNVRDAVGNVLANLLAHAGRGAAGGRLGHDVL